MRGVVPGSDSDGARVEAEGDTTRESRAPLTRAGPPPSSRTAVAPTAAHYPLGCRSSSAQPSPRTVSVHCHQRAGWCVCSFIRRVRCADERRRIARGCFRRELRRRAADAVRRSPSMSEQGNTPSRSGGASSPHGVTRRCATTLSAERPTRPWKRAQPCQPVPGAARSGGSRERRLPSRRRPPTTRSRRSPTARRSSASSCGAG